MSAFGARRDLLADVITRFVCSWPHRCYWYLQGEHSSGEGDARENRLSEHRARGVENNNNNTTTTTNNNNNNNIIIIMIIISITSIITFITTIKRSCCWIAGRRLAPTVASGRHRHRYRSDRRLEATRACVHLECPAQCTVVLRTTANSCLKIPDFGGIDSSRTLMFKGWSYHVHSVLSFDNRYPHEEEEARGHWCRNASWALTLLFGSNCSRQSFQANARGSEAGDTEHCQKLKGNRNKNKCLP